ncbi:MAG: HEAT repeat domain-containing protein, partial [Deltaproteobacteria bacterium]
LRNGGEIRGEVLGDAGSKTRGKMVSIRTLSGATVVVDRGEVDAVVRRRLIVEEYETRRRSIPDTAEEHWDLADWCRRKSLSKEREAELRRVIELDGEHVAAHRALGHIRHQGRWGTQDEVMTARGFVKHKGKYVLPQELELIEQEERVTEAEKAWFRKVKMWHIWLEGGYPERQSEALSQLQAIKEPDAVAALARTFKAVPVEEQRLLYIRIIGKIEGDKPLQPLVLQSLWDESRFVREAAIKGLRNRDVDKALPAYVRALKNGLNMIVNRAGAALGELGNDSVVPQLIDALVTRHSYTVLVPDPPVGVSSDGTDVMTGQAVLPPNIGHMLAAGQLPYGVRVQNLTPTGPRMKEVPIEKDEENPDVLSALTLLTGENFGFDEGAWKNWYNARHNLKRFPGNGAQRKPKSRS